MGSITVDTRINSSIVTKADTNADISLFRPDKIQGGIKRAADHFIQRKKKYSNAKTKNLSKDVAEKNRALIDENKFKSNGKELTSELKTASRIWLPACIGYQKPDISKKQYMQLLKELYAAYGSKDKVRMTLFPNQYRKDLENLDSLSQDTQAWNKRSIEISIEKWNQEDPKEVTIDMEGNVRIVSGSEYENLQELIEGNWCSPPEGYEEIFKKLNEYVIPEGDEKKIFDPLKKNFILNLTADIKSGKEKFSHMDEENRKKHILMETANLIARMEKNTELEVDEEGNITKGVVLPTITIIYSPHQLFKLMDYALEKADHFGREPSSFTLVQFGTVNPANKKGKDIPVFSVEERKKDERNSDSSNSRNSSSSSDEDTPPIFSVEKSKTGSINVNETQIREEVLVIGTRSRSNRLSSNSEDSSSSILNSFNVTSIGTPNSTDSQSLSNSPRSNSSSSSSSPRSEGSPLSTSPTISMGKIEDIPLQDATLIETTNGTDSQLLSDFSLYKKNEKAPSSLPDRTFNNKLTNQNFVTKIPSQSSTGIITASLVTHSHTFSNAAGEPSTDTQNMSVTTGNYINNQIQTCRTNSAFNEAGKKVHPSNLNYAALFWAQGMFQFIEQLSETNTASKPHVLPLVKDAMDSLSEKTVRVGLNQNT